MATGYYEHPEIKQRAEKLKREVRKAIKAAGHEVDEDLRQVDDTYTAVEFGEVGAQSIGICTPSICGGQNRLMVSYLTHIKAPNSPEGFKKATLQDNKKRRLTSKEIAESILAAYKAKTAVERDQKKTERERDKAEAVAKRLTRGYNAPTGTDEISVDARAYVRASYGHGRYYNKTQRPSGEHQAYNVAIEGLTEDEAALVLERLPKALKGLGK